MTSINPFNNQVLNSYARFDLTQLDTLLLKMSAAQREWQSSAVVQRSELLQAMATMLRKRQHELATLATREMGKTLSSALTEVEKCAAVCDYYAEHGPAMIREESVAATDGIERFVSYQPIGIVLAIMPWNFPYWQVFRCLVPALMAGNGVLLKHASNVPGCALAIESICRDAGMPEDLMRTVLVSGPDASRLIEHPLVNAVSFTGSTEAGQKIAACAGQSLKKCVLELGGSDAYLILEDADIDLAVEKCVTSRLLNNGQSCIAAKRFLVHQQVYGEFTEKFAMAFRRQRLGDPMLAETNIGPLARPDLAHTLALQVSESVRLGAVLVCGGLIRPADGADAFYPPTVLGEVRPGMPAFDEELFGPVAALVRVRSESEAVSLANQSIFGLGAGVFTRDIPRGRAIAANLLQAGNCVVNDFVKSDPRLPFGGIKASGFGRELSHFGLREFTNIKSVVVSP
ncbi:NAD-dependent succinate-semialdehyde dehydrogenase [Gammaproteobacteria bacterium LSUCC0112]|nr:NAD-dependent succinate-semialdehyde dehydrogenase [Gammaproteobacteria bacterium LSUCC0112]